MNTIQVFDINYIVSTILAYQMWLHLFPSTQSNLIIILLMTILDRVLKANLIAGAIVFICIIPTIVGNRILLEKYKRPFLDAALLQTGRLQHNENSLHKATWTEREEFRRWLVGKLSLVYSCYFLQTQLKLKRLCTCSIVTDLH